LAISVVILTGLIFAQTKRWLEKNDLLIIPTISFAIIFFIPSDQQAAEGYANWLLTSQGQELIEETGFLRIK
jgi:ABC-type molybdate transport system substrate-binding protein